MKFRYYSPAAPYRRLVFLSGADNAALKVGRTRLRLEHEFLYARTGCMFTKSVRAKIKAASI